LHITQQIPLPLTISCSSKSRLVLPFLVLPFWYLLTRVVPDKCHKSSKTIVCVCDDVCLHTYISNMIKHYLKMLTGILQYVITMLKIFISLHKNMSHIPNLPTLDFYIVKENFEHDSTVVTLKRLLASICSSHITSWQILKYHFLNYYYYYYYYYYYICFTSGGCKLVVFKLM